MIKVASLALCLIAVSSAAQVETGQSEPKADLPQARTTPLLSQGSVTQAVPQASNVPVVPAFGGPFGRKEAPVQAIPHLGFHAVSRTVVRDAHLKPLYTTLIHVPAPVSTLSVGAPTKFEVEHKDGDPLLVFVKPSTHDAAESNLLIAMTNGETISIKLISPGDAPSNIPVDFVLDFRSQRKSLFEEPSVMAALTGSSIDFSTSSEVDGSMPAVDSDLDHAPPDAIDKAISKQNLKAAPHWLSATELKAIVRENALAPNDFAVAIGDVRQEGEDMVISFSIMNTSNHWLMIMPPQIDITDPLITPKKAKKKGNFAQAVLVKDFRLEHPKLAPGERCDGSVTYPKPYSKITKQQTLLHLASSSSTDRPLYYPIPFVAPSTQELAHQEELNVQ